MDAPIYCVAVEPSHPPLALGMVLAAAGRRASIHRDLRSVAREMSSRGPGVVLFSDYIWSVRKNLEISRELKRRFPSAVMVHGGPDVPKDARASDGFMAAHPHIDIAVDGEGEKTFPALLAALEGGGDRPAALEHVAGIVHRRPDGSVSKTMPRFRVDQLDSLPSPYLTGFFDGFNHSDWRAAILETNRGCPYGCTFCDWGSATLQKIRTFGLERIEAEIEWIARRKIAIVFVADANFGILPRDIEIAEQLARAKQRFGYPQQIVVNYAKNATERVAEIIRIFVRAKMTAHGIISLQTTDLATLAAVDRKNIKTSKYEQLIEVFRRERLPLSTDLMLGLPEQTVASIQKDLQFAFDWSLTVQFNQAQMLVNSPMAVPEYRERHALQIEERGYVVSTRTMDEAQAERGRRMCLTFQIFVETGMLRYLLYYLEEEYGLAAMEVLEKLHDDIGAGKLPLLGAVFVSMYSFGPLSLGQLRYRSRTLRTHWDQVYAELEQYLYASYGVRTDSALDTILRVQSALMPRFGARHPKTIELAHDAVAYFRDLGIGQRRYLDPERTTLHLRDYPPGALEITDPENTCWSFPEVRMTYDSHHVPFELHSALRLESVTSRFLKKREVFALKLGRSKVGLAFARARQAVVGRLA